MVAVAFLVPLGAVVRVVAADRGLAVAEQEAQSLAGVLAAQPDATALGTVLSGLNSGNRRVALAFLSSGTRVGPALAVPASELALAREGRAFTASGGGYTRLWVAVRLAGGGLSIGVVAVPSGLLRQGVTAAWVVLGLVGAFVVAAGVLLADRLGRSMVRPIQDLGQVARRLRGGELSARVLPSGPSEVAAVGTAVNELADRIEELLALEREAAADLSHGLRTPLAALRLEADSLQDQDERSRTSRRLAEVTAAVDDLIAQVRAGRSMSRRSCDDLAACLGRRLAFWSLLAEEQGRAWTSELAAGRLAVAATEQEITAMTDALLGNVLAHTPEGTAFRVSLSDEGTQAVLVVGDAGPGFPGDFVSERGTSAVGSTGLGLDIARQAAEAAGGSMELRSDEILGGASVVLRFPLPDLAPA